MEVLIHWERKQNGSSFFSDLLELKKRLRYHLIPPTDFAREESDTWSIQSHRVSSQMSLDCAWGFCWLPLSHSAFPVRPTAMLATMHRTGTGPSRKCQTARWLGYEVHSQLMTPREVYLSFQSCFLCFIFFFQFWIVRWRVSQVKEGSALLLLFPSFVLLLELGPLEVHWMVPLLGLQGPFLVQLMSHK